MKKTYPAYLKGISRRTVAYIFLTVIAASVLLYSCRKIDALPNNTKPIIDPAAVITKNDLLNWYNELPIADPNRLTAYDGLTKSAGKLPFNIEWNRSLQKVINGNHVVKAPMGSNALIVFEKQGKNGSLKSYVFKWQNNKNKGSEYTGDVIRLSFQDYSLIVQQFEKNKLINIYKGKTKGDLTPSEINTVKNFFKTQTNSSLKDKSFKNNSFLSGILTAIVDVIKAMGCLVVNKPYEWSNATIGDDDYLAGECVDVPLFQIHWSASGGTPAGNDINGTISGSGGLLSIGGFVGNIGGSGNDGGVTSGGGTGGGSGSGGSGSNSSADFSNMFWTKFNQMTGGGYIITSSGWVQPTPPPPPPAISQVQIANTSAVLNLTPSQISILDGAKSLPWAHDLAAYSANTLNDSQKAMAKKHIDLLASLSWRYVNIVNQYSYYRYSFMQTPLMWWDNDDFLMSPTFQNLVNDLPESENQAIMNALVESRPNIEFDSGEDNTTFVQHLDNEQYPEFNPQQQQWRNVQPIIGIQQWIYWGYNNIFNCLTLAKLQAAKVGFTCNGYDAPGQTFKISYKNSQGNTVHDNVALRKGISYILSALHDQRPVIVGIDNRPGAPAANPDGLTDHFLTIVGSGTDPDGKHYFRYYENGLPKDGYVFEATHTSLKLYYDHDAGTFQGYSKTEYMKGALFKVTHIRKMVSSNP